MPKLKEYTARRDFSRTPEPDAVGHGSAKGRSYVVQKHSASHLHYDLRLELGGVMLSWAVPKGPSMDPADKRLAIHVEDHPVEYGEFEGTIPEGEYGGGTVMLWDRGTWTPDHGDPREHLAAGHLKFELHGARLNGRWALVRTKGFGKDDSKHESWLLFKERDEEARSRSDFDPIAEWTLSVATGRSMDEIASGAAAVPRQDRMPEKAEFALATLVTAPPQGGDWLHEVKFDGYRILARLIDGRATLESRTHKDWTSQFREIAQALERIGAREAMLDGEIVAMRADGTTDFQALQNRAMSGVPAPLAYEVFDLLYLDGEDLRDFPLLDRKRKLARLLGDSSDVLRYSDHVVGSGEAFFDRACEMGLEGVVSKRVDDRYRPGRTRSWLKSKCLQRQEFVVVGWTDPQRSRTGFGALVLAVRDEGGLRLAGRVGTGFSEASLEEIAARLAKLATDRSPVPDPPKGAAARSVHWVRPELVAEVAFAEWTTAGSLRHPSFLGLRQDKAPEEVVREVAVEAPDTAEQPGAPVVAGILLSSPDKLLWPEAGVSKLALARYYETVADLILPHVAGRPLSVVRCPDGHDGECFYQKHVSNFPRSVGTVGIYEPEEHRERPYGTVRDLPGLIGLVQMDVLEIHPWGSRNDDPDKPDRLVFDIDPDPSLPFSQVAATALLLRSELGRLGLKSWVKSTGGKGLHVVVPVVRRRSWESVKEFCRSFVGTIVAIEPRMFTATMSKARREGRIYIDYLRNSRGATAVAPYSTRARAGAPVAVPLLWDELKEASAPIAVTLPDIRRRLADVAEDPWADLIGTRQSVTEAALKAVGAVHSRQRVDT